MLKTLEELATLRDTLRDVLTELDGAIFEVATETANGKYTPAEAGAHLSEILAEKTKKQGELERVEAAYRRRYEQEQEEVVVQRLLEQFAGEVRDRVNAGDGLFSKLVGLRIVLELKAQADGSFAGVVANFVRPRK